MKRQLFRAMVVASLAVLMGWTALGEVTRVAALPPAPAQREAVALPAAPLQQATATPAPCPDAYEPNNYLSTPAGPFAVPAGGNTFLTNLTLSSPVFNPDVDFYGIDVQQIGYYYTATVMPVSTTFGVQLLVYDPVSANPISERTGGLGAAVRLSWWSSQVGTYKIRVVATNPSQYNPCLPSGRYDILLERSAAAVMPTATPTPTSSPTPTPTPMGGGILTDTLEGTSGNGSFANAAIISVGGTYRNLTFYWHYPTPDIDYYRVWTKAGRVYGVETEVSPGLDTVVYIYNSAQETVASNDDKAYNDYGSLVRWTTGGTDDWYFVRIVNKDPTDPRYKTYVLKFVQEAPNTPTPTNTPQPVPTFVTGYDQFEPNHDFDHATTIALGVKYSSLNFVPYAPWGGNVEDNDFFKLRVKPGLLVTCETLDLSPGTDTNIILYSQSQAEACGRRPVIECTGLGGNDDVNTAAGDFRSRISYFSTYEGWLYILVGQGHPVPLEEAYKFTYSFQCAVGVLPTLTPTPSPVPTLVPLPTSAPLPTWTPLPPPPTLTPPDAASPTPTLTPTPLPPILFRPLPTPTPVGPPRQAVNIELRVFYDRNENNQFDMGEGIVGLQAQVYDMTDGTLLAQGFTDESGRVMLAASALGNVKIVLSYLNFEVVVPPNGGSVQVRVSPRQLPAVIP